ncbi:hypothetical protein [Actinoplanes regularis]|uniref:Uncharacterized protein n=1 Tax=Actinoplanes regularis TaxID=52697 RepID=A0A239IXY5_9ACTN|nr:hypothetical protein [Actinoplanes regularis]GIE91603.1 hypothetical protein Are01nite_80830 [Actinoplanes regularis]SNS97883.1 hypothetical protein SAMN06264365_13143 [Actinoplanes regularis]
MTRRLIIFLMSAGVGLAGLVVLLAGEGLDRTEKIISIVVGVLSLGLAMWVGRGGRPARVPPGPSQGSTALTQPAPERADLPPPMASGAETTGGSAPVAGVTTNVVQGSHVENLVQANQISHLNIGDAQREGM